MSSKAHEQLKILVFSRRAGYTKDFRYRVEYNSNSDISVGYYRDSPVITIYWKKDLVVLSDCGWRTRTTKRLLNTLLPSYLKLLQQAGEWILQNTRYVISQGMFAWTGSQTFSLSEHYKTHVTPWATMKFELGQVTVKPEPFQIITITKSSSGWSVVLVLISAKYTIVTESTREVSGPFINKNDAINVALTYSAQNRIPFIEKLRKVRYLGYEFNPNVY